MTPDASPILTSPASFDTFYKTYVDSWRITDAGPQLFEYRDGESTTRPDITNRDFPRNLQTVATWTADSTRQARRRAKR